MGKTREEKTTSYALRNIEMGENLTIISKSAT